MNYSFVALFVVISGTLLLLGPAEASIHLYIFLALAVGVYAGVQWILANRPALSPSEFTVREKSQ